MPGIGATIRCGPAPEAAILFPAPAAAAVQRDRHTDGPHVNGQLTRRGVPRHGDLVAESAAKPDTRPIRVRLTPDTTPTPVVSAVGDLRTLVINSDNP